MEIFPVPVVFPVMWMHPFGNVLFLKREESDEWFLSKMSSNFKLYLWFCACVRVCDSVGSSVKWTKRYGTCRIRWDPWLEQVTLLSWTRWSGMYWKYYKAFPRMNAKMESGLFFMLVTTQLWVRVKTFSDVDCHSDWQDWMPKLMKTAV